MSNRVRIPAEVQREDRLLAGLTARQLAVVAGTAVVVYGGWVLTRSVLPLAVFALLAAPVVLVAVALVVGRRDGVSLDRLLWSALRFYRQPRRRVADLASPQPVPDWLAQAAVDHTDPPTAGVDLPARGVSEAGVVDLGADGLAVLASCSTVNFALRAEAEQDALIAGFARYLHSLTAGVQLLIRTEHLDVSAQIDELLEYAPKLADPGLERAARAHAEYLAALTDHTDLLRRHVLLVLREPTSDTTSLDSGSRWRRARSIDAGRPDEAALRAAAGRLSRRVGEAADVLAAAGITVTPLQAEVAAAVLSAACDPDRSVPTSRLAAPGAIITTHDEESHP